MKKIKRLDNLALSQKYGLETTSTNYIFKPLEMTPNRQHEPHRSSMYSLGLIVEGKATFHVGINQYEVQAPAVLAVSPEQVRQWTVNESIQTVSIFFSESFAVEGLSDPLFLTHFPFYKPTGKQYIPLNNETFRHLQAIFELIAQKDHSTAFNRMESIRSLIHVLLFEVESLQEDNNKPASFSQAQHITIQFKKLLTQHFKAQREVQYYAEQLHISPKHLSQTLKEQTGKTASELIDDLVCLEAKVLLQVQQLNIAEVAELLNFPNPSFFGKFFKRITGMSPLQYRKSLH
ncbi:helix-turn-helix domain-containing protein [Limibacter armeniacum]|uniref:helix-turn-helix domain-containing protein n=1 Tax=Limibacter armeniacum TaxID=466084 RepID=UPI002FE637ED